jgi:hypothetical protein
MRWERWRGGVFLRIARRGGAVGVAGMMVVMDTHLSGHHRDTLDRLLQHPTSHNTEWPDVVSLLEAVGTITQRHDGRYAVTVGQDRVIIDRPHHKEIGEQLAVDLRAILTHAGYTPRAGHED